MMPQKQRKGYIRTDLGLRILDFQWLVDGNMPAIRLLAVKTEDGVLSLVVDREVADDLLRDLQRIVPEIPKAKSLS